MSETASTPPYMKSYQNGPFTVSESTLSLNGRDWLSLKVSLSQEVMVPIPDAFSHRKTQLESERAVLGMLSDRVSEAIESLVGMEDDK